MTRRISTLDEIDETPPLAEPDDLPPKQDEWARLAMLRDRVRTQLGAHEEWIVGEFEMIEKELTWVRSRLLTPNKKQPTLWFTHAKEVLEAVDAGVCSRLEARRILGLKGRKLPVVRRAPARRRR